MEDKTELDTSGLESGADNDQSYNGKLYLSDQEAYRRALSKPDDREPVYIVYAPNDTSYPRNWSKLRKWYITFIVTAGNVIATIGSGSSTSAAKGIAQEFKVSDEVTTLLLSIFVLGLAIGPLILAPLSERFGRRPVYAVGWSVLFIFQLPAALAPNIGTLIVVRFIAGLGGSCTLANAGGTISDLWSRNTNGYPMAMYGVSRISGVPFALVVTGYIDFKFGWRSVFWANMGIFGGFWLLLISLPETRHSAILERKTTRLRKKLRKEGYNAANIRDMHSDAPEPKGLAQLFKITLTRPFVFLFTEPITYFSAIYNGFVLGVLFLFNEAFPLLFGDEHHFNGGEQGLAFLGLVIGPVIGGCFHFLQEVYYKRRVAKNDGLGVPEARMWSAMPGSIMIVVGLFWFAWTSYPSIPWIVPIIASGLFGLGIYTILLATVNFIVDSYQTYSASALASLIFVCNLTGAGFPLFARQMYTGMGLEWASSLLGFVAILLIPVPFLFFFKGETIRMRSPYAREHFFSTEDKAH